MSITEITEYLRTASPEEVFEVKKVLKTSRLKGGTIDDIIEMACEYFNLTRQQLCGKCKKREYNEPRQMTIKAIKDNTRLYLKEIGSKFNNRDHSSVIHACNTVKDLCDTDEKYRRTYEELNEYIFKN